MSIRKPYYGIHQITPGLFTPGNEYILEDGSDYVGAFHVLPNNQKFTENIPKPSSQELFEKRLDLSESVKKYNILREQSVSKYVSPIPYQPKPVLDDYTFGEIQRFFVQKRNNPMSTIAEIDNVQYNTINISNFPGINGVIWNKLMIPWKISRIPPDDVAVINRRTLIAAEHVFPGIGLYITNVLEYYI